MKSVHKLEPDHEYTERLKRERSHFNSLASQCSADSLLMPLDNILRYDSPSSQTPYALEYAFHLLGKVQDKHVLCLGCGQGLDVVILASLGANVTAIDISDESIGLAYERAKANGVAERIRFMNCDAAELSPVADNSIDKALCAAIFHHIDIAGTARELRRVIKPGGVVVCLEPLEVPPSLKPLRGLLPKGRGISEDERPLTPSDVALINDTIGTAGAERKFGLTCRALPLLRTTSKRVTDLSHNLDAWLIRNSSVCEAFASPLVWKVAKHRTEERPGSL